MRKKLGGKSQTILDWIKFKSRIGVTDITKTWPAWTTTYKGSPRRYTVPRRLATGELRQDLRISPYVEIVETGEEYTQKSQDTSPHYE